MLSLANETPRYEMPSRLLRYWHAVTLKKVGVSAESNAQLSFVSRERIRSLYETYGGVSKATTVLAFPWREGVLPGQEAEPNYLGEIYIAPSVVEEVFGSSAYLYHAALRHVVVHATLHLVGFDHARASRAVEMRSLEKRILGDHFLLT